MGAFTVRNGVAAFTVALLLGGGTAKAIDSATEAPYPLPAAEQNAGTTSAHAKRTRRARPARSTHVPLAPVRPARQAIEPASVPLPPKATQAAPPATPEPRKELPAGWRLVTDPATGVLIGLPDRLFTQTHDAPHGTLWSSPHGEVQVETFRIQQPDWKALFERMKSQPRTRRVQTSSLQDDSFTISGTQGLKDFAVRAAQRDGEARGFSIIYDQAMEGTVAPVIARMTNAFAAFPEQSAPFALPTKAVAYGTGIAVSGRGDVITSARLTQNCTVLVVAGFGPAERVATEHGIALLRVFGAHKIAPIAFSESAAAPGPLRLIGVPDPREQSGGGTAREVAARLSEHSDIALERPAPMAGFAGAAAIDAQGRFAGLVELAGVQVAANAPVTPPLQLIDAASIRGVLDAHSVPVSQIASGDPNANVVRVICVRK